METDIMKTDFLHQAMSNTGITQSDGENTTSSAEEEQGVLVLETDPNDANINVTGIHRCPFCFAEFTIHLDLQKHMNLYHNVKRKFLCQACGKRFPNKHELTVHENTRHLGEKPFQCILCSTTFTSKASLERHKLIHTGEKPHQCNFCRKTFRMKYMLKEHVRIHTGEKPYGCDFCDKRFASSTERRIHLRQHSGVKEFQCDLCDRGYWSAKRLANHKKSHAADAQRTTKTHKCPVCSLEFTELSDLHDHVRQQHPQKSKTKKIVPVSTPTEFHCEECMVYLSSYEDLSKHAEEEHGLFQCRKCKKQFPNRDAVKRHLRKEHNEGTGFACHICDHLFPNDDALTTHLTVHELFVCSLCDASFGNMLAKKEHMQKAHSPEMMETCRICLQQFVSKKRLQRHLQCHAPPAPHKCPICKACFNHEPTVTRHMNVVHNIVRETPAQPTSANSFQMEYDGHMMSVIFADPNTGAEDLKAMIMSEENDSYKCTVCQLECDDKALLNLHVDEHDTAEILLALVQSQRQKSEAEGTPMPKDIIVTRASKPENGHAENLDCAVCGEVFQTDEALQKHVLEHDQAAKALDDSSDDDLMEEFDDVLHDTESYVKVPGQQYTDVGQLFQPQRRLVSRCRYCDKLLASEHDLKVHEQMHCQVMDFRCLICNEEFVDPEDLVNHKDVHKKRHRKSYQCAHCGLTMSEPTLMKTHIETHSENVISVFDETGQAVQQIELSKEPEIVEEAKETVKTSFSCETCRLWFDSKSKLAKHLSTHRENKPHVCSTCGRGFTKLATLKYHEKSHSVSEPYGCTLCEAKFDQVYRLKVHMMETHGQSRFHCETCDQSFPGQDELSKHKQRHAKATDVSCAVCDSRFVTIRALRQHVREHCSQQPEQLEMLNKIATEKPEDKPNKRVYWCIICSASFDREEDLNDHSNKHFKCDHCATEYADSLELECHSLDHAALEKNICLSCGDNFDDVDSLWEHTMANHQDTPVMRCTSCPKICVSARHLKIHAMTHPLTEEANFHCEFFCNICQSLFPSESFLNIHNERHKPCQICEDVSEDLTLHLLQNHALPQVEKCYHCDRVLTDPDARADHLNMHALNPEVLERCADCENGFPDMETLEEHMKTGHNLTAAKCVICGMLCMGNDGLHEHLRREHMVFDIQRCAKCTKIFLNASVEDMVKHAVSHEPKTELNCCVCNVKFTDPNLLQQHLQTHTTLSNVYQCVECTDTFSGTKAFRYHMRQRHGVVAKLEQCRLLCGICKNVLRLESIGNHLKVHTSGGRRFACSVCPLTFTAKHSLERHFLIHTNDKPAICDICGNGFRNLDRLKQHQRRHTKDARHKCDVKGCKKTFILKTKLRDHQARIHGYDAPFKCILCEDKFVFRRQLKEHMQKHTGKKFPCHVCDMEMNSIHSLRMHLKTKHGESMPKKQTFPCLCEFCQMPLYNYAMKATHQCPEGHVSLREVYQRAHQDISTLPGARIVRGPAPPDSGLHITDDLETDDGVPMEGEVPMESESMVSMDTDQNEFVYLQFDNDQIENGCSICMLQFGSAEEAAAHMLLHQGEVS